VLNNLNERAVVVALAKLAGVEGNEKEVYDKFFAMYQAVLQEMSENSKPAEVKTFQRPF